jgi:asparagine synthase (glutamine-hydrolysing)
MRRALVGIVPAEILNRRSKAFVARAPRVAVSKEWANLLGTTQHMVTSSLGIVDPCGVSEALLKARRGEEVPMIPLMRTVWIEGWLKDLRAFKAANFGPIGKSEYAWNLPLKGNERSVP